MRRRYEGELGISRRTSDGATIITAVGDIDLLSTPSLRDAIMTSVDQTESGPFVLDLTEVTFFGSAGLALLVAVHSHVTARGDELRIVVDANRSVIRPIEITGLDTTLNLFHTVAEALR